MKNGKQQQKQKERKKTQRGFLPEHAKQFNSIPNSGIQINKHQKKRNKNNKAAGWMGKKPPDTENAPHRTVPFHTVPASKTQSDKVLFMYGYFKSEIKHFFCSISGFSPF